MSIVKTHTGTVITKDGPRQKLLQEMVHNEPGARERAIEFIRLYGAQL